MPVFLQHGISARSLAEYFFGAAKECRNIIQLVIDENVGAAIITDGALLHAGSHSIGRNRSHTDKTRRVNPVTAVITAVWKLKLVCIMYWKWPLSSWPFRRGKLLTAEMLCRAALDGNPAARELIEQVGQHIGDIAAVMVNIFNPEIILIGSPLNPASSVLFPAIRRPDYAARCRHSAGS